MRRLRSYTSISLDGYFTDAKGDMSWAHKRDDEWNAFASSNASGDAALLFGRVTYEMMKAFWPTPQAAQQMPEVAAGMNRMPKYVVSRTLGAADWQNTTVLKGDLVTDIQALKATDGPDVVILLSRPAEVGGCRAHEHLAPPTEGRQPVTRDRRHPLVGLESDAVCAGGLLQHGRNQQDRAGSCRPGFIHLKRFVNEILSKNRKSGRFGDFADP